MSVLSDQVSRTCFRDDGLPKAVFEDRRAAKRAALVAGLQLRARMQVYRCALHGYHIGKAHGARSRRP